MKAKKLEGLYGTVDQIPTLAAQQIFDKDSLENAPVDWDKNPVFAKIFKQSMMDVCSGDDPNEFRLAKLMKNVKLKLQSGYDFKIYHGPNGRPSGVMQMTPYQCHNFRRFGNVISCDMQLKRKNTMGWGGCFPAGKNNDNKLVNFADGLAYEELDQYTAFILRTISVQSRVPLQTLIIMTVDCKLEIPKFRQRVPGR